MLYDLLYLLVYQIDETIFHASCTVLQKGSYEPYNLPLRNHQRKRYQLPPADAQNRINRSCIECTLGKVPCTTTRTNGSYSHLFGFSFVGICNFQSLIFCLMTRITINLRDPRQLELSSYTHG